MARARLDPIAAILALSCLFATPLHAGDVFLRGDANGDGKVGYTDVSYLVNHAFFGGPPPPCERAADANDDNELELTILDPVSDLRYLVDWFLLEGPPPPAPFPSPGTDPSPDDVLGCAGEGDPPPEISGRYALEWAGPGAVVPGTKGVEFFLQLSSAQPIEGFSAAFRFDPGVLTNLSFDLEGTAIPEAARDAIFESPFARLNLVREPFGPNDEEVDQLFLGVLFVVEAGGGGALADGGVAGFALERLAFGIEKPFRGLPLLRMTADIREDAPANTLVDIILPLRPDELPEGGLRTEFIFEGALAANVDPFATARRIALGEAGEILFKRGDYDGDNTVDLSDAVSTFSFLFLGAAAPSCLDAADSDDNGEIELTDGVRTLNFLFLGGPEPEFPGVRGGCGLDLSPDPLLSCTEENACGTLSAP